MAGAMTMRLGVHNPPAGGSTAVTIRGSSKLYVNNASSGTITLPSGSAADDFCMLFVGHGYNAVAPTGWGSLDNSTGANYNGAVFYKKLTSADVSTGTATVTFGGSYYGTIIAATIVGTSYLPRQISPQRNGSGSTSRTITTASGPVAGDRAFYFGSARASTGASTSSGASLQSDTGTNSSAVLSSEAVAATGTVSETFNYGSGSIGDYQAVLIINGTAVVPGTTSDQWRINVTATQGAGQFPGIAEIELRASVGGPDQCIFGSGSDSAHYSNSYLGANAFDNNSSSYWLADSAAPQWVQWTNYYTIDVAQIAITQGGTTNQAPTAFSLQYYNHGTSSWTTLQSWTTPATWAAGETRTFNV